MRSFSLDSRNKLIIIVAAAVGVAVVGFVIVFIVFFSPTGGGGNVAVNGGKKEVSERAVKKLKDAAENIQNELQEEFYKNLKGYKWNSDNAKPGKSNPFLE